MDVQTTNHDYFVDILQELSEQITRLQSQVSGLDAALLQEKTSHSNTKDELDNLRKQMEISKEEMVNERAELKAKMDSKNKSAKTVLKAMEEVCVISDWL